MRSLRERRRDRNKGQRRRWKDRKRKREPREKRLKQTKFVKAVLVYSNINLNHYISDRSFMKLIFIIYNYTEGLNIYP